MFSGFAMLAARLYFGWPYMTAYSFWQLCRNYSDIDTIEVDAYVNTQHAQVDAIQTINSDGLRAVMWFEQHRTAIAEHS